VIWKRKKRGRGGGGFGPELDRSATENGTRKTTIFVKVHQDFAFGFIILIKRCTFVIVMEFEGSCKSLIEVVIAAERPASHCSKQLLCEVIHTEVFNCTLLEMIV
jgi:hypothetical protein